MRPLAPIFALTLGLGLAGAARAQEPGEPREPTAPKETKPPARKNLEETRREWEHEYKQFSYVVLDVGKLTRKKTEAEEELAPIKGRLTALEKQAPSFKRDEELKSVLVEHREALQRTGWASLRLELDRAEERLRDTRERAIDAGWNLAILLFDSAERIRPLEGREPQANAHVRDALDTLDVLRKVEDHKVRALPEALVPDSEQPPKDPKECLDLAAAYQAEARRADEQVRKLSAQQEKLESSMARLAQVEKKGYADGNRARSMLEKLSDRLGELRRRTSAYATRAQRFGDEAAKLTRLGNELPK